MRDVNSMSKWGYVIENIIWMTIAIYWYKLYCFTNIFEFDDDISKCVLYLTVVVFVFIGLALTIERRRNSVNTFINIALPLAIYTSIAYFNYLEVFIISSFVIAAFLSIVYIAMTKKYSSLISTGKPKYFNFKRFSILGTRTIVTVCSMLVVVYLLATTITGIQLFRPNYENAECYVQSFVEYYEDNAATFVKLEQNTWNKLAPSEKLDVLQVVCNAEKVKLGIQEPIYIRSKAFKSNLLGEYVYQYNTVLINIKHLEEDSSYSVLSTVTHECYHSYERSLVSLYNNVDDEQKKLMTFDRAKQYKEEFANYKDGDSEDYYWQTVEKDAREYSEKATEDYRDKILSHLENSD